VGEERKPGARRIGDLVAELMKSPAVPPPGELTDLAAAWARAAGPEVARRSRPLGLRNGELTVGFESAAVRQEVESFRRPEILARLRTEMPGRRVAAIRCVLRG